MLSHQLIFAESLNEDDIMLLLWKGDELSPANDYCSCLMFTGATEVIRGTQNGCSETNIVRRMMELPRKLMTLLTVTISRSSTTSRGPLMGRDKTSVALTLLVCCRGKEDNKENVRYGLHDVFDVTKKHLLCCRYWTLRTRIAPSPGCTR